MSELSRLSLAVLLGAALLGGCKACSSEPGTQVEERPVLGGVTIKTPKRVAFRGEEISLVQAPIADKVKDAIGKSDIFANAVGKHPVANVTVEAEPLVAESPQVKEVGVRVRLHVSIVPAGSTAAHFDEDVAAIGQTELANPGTDKTQDIFQRLTERTTQDLVQGYCRRQKIWQGDSHAVAAALSASDEDARIEAARVVGAHKMHALVPTVVRLLSDEDEGVRDAALGALVALRERSTIKALADSHQMRDPREMRKVLDAIATLGGQEAQDYLAFVAETHDDEEIKEMAKEALGRLRNGAGSSKPTK
jgi:HEAT repeats